MKKPDLKYALKEAMVIAFCWLVALAVVYVVFLKIWFFYHH